MDALRHRALQCVGAVVLTCVTALTYLSPSEWWNALLWELAASRRALNENRLVSFLRAWLHLFTTLLRLLLTLLSPKRPSSTPPLNLLSQELVRHILLVGRLEGTDLAHCSAASKVLAAAITDPASDGALWGRACQLRWADKAYDPSQLHARRFRKMCYRERFQWAEEDGSRRRGTAADLWGVEVWEVTMIQLLRAEPYQIRAFPYRRNGQYWAHGNPPRRYTVHHVGMLESSLVYVDGLPAVRLTRREDWGWELRNPLWVARSIVHNTPPFD